jgi:hypothetical protein
MLSQGEHNNDKIFATDGFVDRAEFWFLFPVSRSGRGLSAQIGDRLTYPIIRITFGGQSAVLTEGLQRLQDFSPSVSHRQQDHLDFFLNSWGDSGGD